MNGSEVEVCKHEKNSGQEVHNKVRVAYSEILKITNRSCQMEVAERYISL
jgi:hypothetical protein